MASADRTPLREVSYWKWSKMIYLLLKYDIPSSSHVSCLHIKWIYPIHSEHGWTGCPRNENNWENGNRSSAALGRPWWDPIWITWRMWPYPAWGTGQCRGAPVGSTNSIKSPQGYLCLRKLNLCSLARKGFTIHQIMPCGIETLQ